MTILYCRHESLGWLSQLRPSISAKAIADQKRASASALGETVTTVDLNLPERMDGGTLMKHRTFFLVAVTTMAGLVALVAPSPGHADGEPAPYVTEIPHGYRNWQWVSSAHEAGNLNSLGALLGNDVAMKAFREGKLPFPDGTILAALHYRNVPSDENNKIFGQVQSFVPGAPTNIQFMVKDSKKYAATGGWGFGHFADGKPGDAAFM
jgi:hypothetical protein